MKKLVISMKSTEELFSDLKKEAKKIKKATPSRRTHYEISFEDKRDFDRFVKNIHILMAILHNQPHSVYQLAKIVNKDLSNVKKVIAFFEEIGAITLKEQKVGKRSVKKPVVDYDRVEFDLNAA